MSDLKKKIIQELKMVYDPEIPVNIYDLGLIYNIGSSDDSTVVVIQMTLTSPNCPVAEDMPKWVQEAVMNVEGVTDVEVKLTWDPPWDKDKMTEAAKLELNL